MTEIGWHNIRKFDKKLKSNSEAIKLFDIYSNLFQISAELKNINSRYLIQGNEVFSRYSNYYNNSENNINHLNGISNKIKFNAIELSFQHLQEVANELHLVKDKVASIAL